MKRALLLICVLSVLCVGASLWFDHRQTAAAEGYLAELPALRAALLAGERSDAWKLSGSLAARWQRDEGWLNCLVSHHHTRAVNTALLQLATALEQDWPDEALRALDALYDALGDVAESDAPTLSNLL